MSQDITKRNLTPASLRGRQTVHSVLMRMAVEEERAARVRALKADRPDLTWGRIAEQIGIKERSVIQWQKTGGMDYENAKKFAKLMDVTPEWLWSGVETQAGNGKKPATSQGDRLQQIDEKLDRIIERLDELDAGAIERDELAAALLDALRDASTAGSVPGRRRRAS